MFRYYIAVSCFRLKIPTNSVRQENMVILRFPRALFSSMPRVDYAIVVEWSHFLGAISRWFVVLGDQIGR